MNNKEIAKLIETYFKYDHSSTCEFYKNDILYPDRCTKCLSRSKIEDWIEEVLDG